MYDSVHILKNLRINWINKKDDDQTITFFVEVDNIKVKKYAKFKHVYDFYSA